MKEADERLAEMFVEDGVDERVQARLGHGQPLQLDVEAPVRVGGNIHGRGGQQRRPEDDEHDERGHVAAQ